MRTLVASAGSLVAAGGLAFGLMSAPASAAPAATPAHGSASHVTSASPVHPLGKVTGKSKCFTYSYDNGGKASVTLYYHNRCAHHKCLEVSFKHRPISKHIWAAGKRHGKRKFKAVNPDIRHVAQVRAWQCH